MCREVPGVLAPPVPYEPGVTLIFTALLVTLPITAVIVTVPLVVLVVTSDTKPPETVANAVLLEFHVATLVTSCEPLHVDAVAVSVSVVLFPVRGSGPVGVT